MSACKRCGQSTIDVYTGTACGDFCSVTCEEAYHHEQAGREEVVVGCGCDPENPCARCGGTRTLLDWTPRQTELKGVA